MEFKYTEITMRFVVPGLMGVVNGGRLVKPFG